MTGAAVTGAAVTGAEEAEDGSAKTLDGTYQETKVRSEREDLSCTNIVLLMACDRNSKFLMIKFVIADRRAPMERKNVIYSNIHDCNFFLNKSSRSS